MYIYIYICMYVYVCIYVYIYICTSSQLTYIYIEIMASHPTIQGSWSDHLQLPFAKPGGAVAGVILAICCIAMEKKGRFNRKIINQYWI